MADLQTEIFKKVLPKMRLNQLTFDDDVNTQEVHIEVEQPTTNQTELIWRFIRDNPGSTASEVARSNIISDSGNVATRITQLVKRGIVRQDKTVHPAKNYTTTVGYKSISMEERIQRMNAARKDGTKKPKKIKVVKRKVAPQVQASQGNILDTMSVVQARALYDQLKQIFGG